MQKKDDLLKKDEEQIQLSIAIIRLLKKPIDLEKNKKIYSTIMYRKAEIESYLNILNLKLYFDERDGYAFVFPNIYNSQDNKAMPQILSTKKLCYGMSILCILLREWLIQNDANGSELRAIIQKQKIIDEVSLYLKDEINEIKKSKKIDTYINQAIKLGLLKRLKNNIQDFEINKITKAIINPEWLGNLDNVLINYQEIHNRKKDEK